MPRFLTLTLPLLAIWFFIYQNSDPKLDPALSQRVEMSSPSSALSHPASPLSSASSQTVEGALRQLAYSRLSAPFPKQAHEAEDLPKPPIPEQLVGSPELLEYVWGEIDPDLRSALSPAEAQNLRSMIARLISPAANDQPWLCWGPGTPKQKVLAFHQAEELTGMRSSGVSLFANQFLGAGRWNNTATDGSGNFQQGLPMTLTWSIIPDGTIIPGRDAAPPAPSNFRAWMASIYGGSETGPAADQGWFSIFESAFDAMANTCGVNFVYEPADDQATVVFAAGGQLGLRGDIRIGARFIDGDSNVLAYATSPGGGDIIFDSGDSAFDRTDFNSLTLFNTTTHELGHAMGLDHVCPLNRTKLMEPLINRNFRGPRFDEFQSLQRQYGDVLERSGSARNNDSSSRANNVTLIPDQSRDFSRLSIDDNTDVDYLRLDLRARQKISASIVPVGTTYLEGAEVNGSCSSGTNFNAATQQNLTLEILGPDGTTVLASSLAGGRGVGEEITSFEVPSNATHFIRINGGSDNAAQLYDLNLFLEERPPAPEFLAGKPQILAESGSVKNFRLDDRETVRANLVYTNSGNLSTTSLTARIEAPANVTVFSTGEAGQVIAPGEVAMIPVVLASTAACGEEVTLTLVLEDSGVELARLSYPFMVGNIITTSPLDEGFDASTLLPSTWTTSFSGGGENWRTSSARSSSPLRSVFVPGEDRTSQSILVSPEVNAGTDGGILSFANFYNTESTYDGGVLEVSRNGGAWLDLPSASTVLSGGYNATINTNFGSAIGGRRAWSGTAPTFFTSSFQLPATWANENLRFRWRLVHDGSIGQGGWYIDDVTFTRKAEDCIEHRPVLLLSASTNSLDENFPSAESILTVSPELPLLDPVNFTLIPTGTAVSSDFSGGLSSTIPAGTAAVNIPISVTVDDLDEELETLILTLPDGNADFAPGATASQTLTITDLSDRPDFAGWQLSFFPEIRDPLGDSDRDGFSDLAEYLLGTDPSSATSRGTLSPVMSGESFLLPVGVLPERTDATLILQASSNLTVIDWVNIPLETTPDGILLPTSAERRFYRLVYRLNE